MPTFCRHNRLVENCRICSRKEQGPGVLRSAPARRAPKPAGTRVRAPKASSGVVVRRMARAVEDGYVNDLVPGLRASDDARRLAAELAHSAARLERLAADPPGLYAEAAGAEDREEALWLCFLIAYLSPLEDGDPWEGVAAARVPWATGELPRLDGVAFGPRTAHDPARAQATFAAYRAWASRAGSQLAGVQADPSWTAPRRADRAFERLALPGLHRAARLEYLVLAGRLGIADVEPASLMFSAAAATDPVALSAKRVFGIGDALNLQRRASELAHEAQVPVIALDLALHNWARSEAEPRVTTAVPVEGDGPPELRDRVARVLGVAHVEDAA